MADSLENTVALVTGASSGIGEAAALALARREATVALAARRTDRLEALAEQVRRDGGTAVPITLDVTDAEATRAAVDRVADELGRLDTVVNNAGVMLLGRAENGTIEDWDRMVSLNVQGLLYVAHAALPHLLAAADDGPRRVADLVNISSVAGRTARPGSAVYNLTKHGVGAFSEALRQEVTGRHLRVSLVEPGAVATELQDHLSPQARAGFEKRFDGLETLQADDIAETIEFIVTRPRHVAVNEVLVRPTDQEG